MPSATALDAVSLDDLRAAAYDGTYEDFFFYVERLIVQGCGEDRRRPSPHGAQPQRHRHDDVPDAAAGVHARAAGRDRSICARSLLDLASRHRDTMFAVHTHTQRAQPTTVAHYLLAVVEQLERDGARLRAAYASTNQNPLGACAITGTGFHIDRTLTSELLGFSGPTGNTYGSIATVDYLLESASAATVLLVGLGRFVQDFLLWSHRRSSTMSGLATGSCSPAASCRRSATRWRSSTRARSPARRSVRRRRILTTVHNTPFGDIVDTEDDLQPLVFSMFRDATRAVKVVAAAMATAEFDAERLEARAGCGWTTLTELADTLVRDHGLPFKTAHAISGKLIARAPARCRGAARQLLSEASGELLPAPLTYSEEALEEILSPRHFVMVRRTYGGPAPEETMKASKASRAAFDADRTWWATTNERLTHAQERLAARAARL